METFDLLYFTGEIINMYINVDLDDEEYVRVKVNLIPPNIMVQYNLHDKVH